MHDMREPFNLHILFHMDGSRSADPSQIISSQVYQHIMLRQFFFISQEFLLKSQIFFLCLSPGPGSRQRKGVYFPVFQLCQSLRRSPCHFNIITGKIKHIWGRIGCTEHPVSIKQASSGSGGHWIGQYDLENIPFPDILLCLLHHCAVCFLIRPE